MPGADRVRVRRTLGGMPQTPTPPPTASSPWHALVWLLPGVAASLLMVFAPQLVLAVCPRELKATQGCGMLFPTWTYGVLAVVVAGSVAWTVRAWRKAARGG